MVSPGFCFRFLNWCFHCDSLNGLQNSSLNKGTKDKCALLLSSQYQIICRLNQVNAVSLRYDATRIILQDTGILLVSQVLSNDSNHSIGSWFPLLNSGKSTKRYS